MEVSMRDKAGLVTGAADGIGRAAAVALAAAGACVVVSDLDAKRAGGEETVRLIREAGGRAAFQPCDVTDSRACAALVAYTLDAFGGLDFACNNAGISGALATIPEIDEADFDRQVAVNLKGVWLSMKHQIPVMTERGGGSIVNTSSLSGLVVLPRLGAYTAAKHGVIGLTRTAALEFAEHGVRVNAICPAAVQTPMTDARPPEIRKMLPQIQAIKRYAQPWEIAAAVVYLLSDQAAFLTGLALPLDGGATITVKT